MSMIYIWEWIAIPRVIFNGTISKWKIYKKDKSISSISAIFRKIKPFMQEEWNHTYCPRDPSKDKVFHGNSEDKMLNIKINPANHFPYWN